VLKFERSRGWGFDGEWIVFVRLVSFTFSVGRDLWSPSTNAVLVGSLESVVELRDHLWIIPGLALATTIWEFTLLEETSWWEAPRGERMEITHDFGLTVQAPVGIHEF
jgi:hypothetical protein